MKSTLTALLIASFVVLATPGCAPTYQTNKDRLRDDSQRFNENLRWQRFREASLSVAPEAREAWLRSQERAGSVFTIADYEVKPVEVGRELAVLQVDLVFHRVGDVTIHQQRRQQVWRYQKGTWFLESDREIPRDEEPPPDHLPDFGTPLGETGPG
ncbi:MAG: hypothetical protein H6744_11990 [Deltaproteobacteria bacterium]|nr:hypothetical protein [Deltaproteobacteria bacterium]MCB9787391.1 hypothetical protein [Deltaproteobacteria bacterium]